MITLTLVALIAFASLFVGFVSRKPALDERALILDPTKRGVTSAFYILGGIAGLIPQCANRVVYVSTRYGASLFDLDNLFRLLAIAPLFLAVALHIGWIAFDITKIGHWAFFPADAPLAARVFGGAVYFSAVALICLGFAMRPAFNLFARRHGAKSGDFFFHFMALAPMALPALLLQNTGLLHFLAFPLLAAHKRYGWGILFAYAFILYAMQEKMGALISSIVVFCFIAGLLAWLCLRVVVELNAAANWSDSSDGRVVFYFALSAILAFFCVLAVPPLTVVTMDLLAPLLPQNLGAGWQDLLGFFRQAGHEVAWMIALAAATPFFPVVAALIYGLGSAIGNTLPAAKRFRATLKMTEGYLSDADYTALTADRRTAYFAGYAAATAITLALTLTALFFASNLIFRMF